MIRNYHQMKAEAREHMREGEGTVLLTEILTPEEMMGKGRLFSEITLEPGCSIGQHEHKGEAEIFFITQGVATVDDNGITQTLTAGDMLYTGDGSYHSIANHGDETLRLVALILFS